MDPLTVFSLACSVVQVVDFSIKVLSSCREIYKDGASSENGDLADMTDRLKGLRIDLTAASRDPISTGVTPLFEDDRGLQMLATKCCETADELGCRA